MYLAVSFYIEHYLVSMHYLRKLYHAPFCYSYLSTLLYSNLSWKKLDINYSLKNIPIPSNESYLIKLIEKIESVVNRICWRAHFFLQEKHESDIQIEDFKLQSKNTPPQREHMETFENEFLDMISSIKFDL